MKIAKTTNQLRKKGFTLIEVIIVIAILGTLTAVAVPSYNALQNNSTAKVCAETRQSLVNELVSRRLLNNEAVMTSFHLLYPAVYTCPESGTFDLPNYKEDESSFTVICTAHGSSEGSLGDKTNGSNAEVDTELPSVSVVTPEAPKPEPEPEPEPGDPKPAATDNLVVAINRVLEALKEKNSTEYNKLIKYEGIWPIKYPYIDMKELLTGNLKEYGFKDKFVDLILSETIGHYTGGEEAVLQQGNSNNVKVYLNEDLSSVKCVVYNKQQGNGSGDRVFYFLNGNIHIKDPLLNNKGEAFLANNEWFFL